MRSTIRGLAGFLALGALALAASPAVAWRGDDFERRRAFPVPPDPWRHWGAPLVHKHQVVPPRHHVAPHRNSGAVFAVPRQPVWVSDHWAWNGFRWVWIPGHWR